MYDISSSLNTLQREVLEVKHLIDQYFVHWVNKPFDQIVLPILSSQDERIEELGRMNLANLNLPNQDMSENFKKLEKDETNNKMNLEKPDNEKSTTINQEIQKEKIISSNENEIKEIESETEHTNSHVILNLNRRKLKEQIIKKKLFSTFKMEKLDKLNDDFSEISKSSFEYFKKYKKIKNPKFHLRHDCLRKKVKTLVYKYILSKVNKYLLEDSSDMFLFKVPKEIIYHARNQESSIIINMSIKDIFSIPVPNEEQRVRHNIDIIARCRNPKFVKFMSKKFSEVYIEYLNSYEYIKNTKYILKVEGEEYCREFKKVSIEFLDFHT